MESLTEEIHLLEAVSRLVQKGPNKPSRFSIKFFFCTLLNQTIQEMSDFFELS